MEKTIQTSIGEIRVYIHGGFHTSEKKEQGIHFDARHENPVIINGIPYSFSWHFYRKGPDTQNGYNYNWLGDCRYEGFYSSRQDEKKYERNSGMSSAARNKLEKIVEEIYKAITPEEFQEAERESIENEINRKTEEMNELQKEIQVKQNERAALQKLYGKLFGKVRV